MIRSMLHYRLQFIAVDMSLGKPEGHFPDNTGHGQNVPCQANQKVPKPKSQNVTIPFSNRSKTMIYQADIPYTDIAALI